MDESRERRKVLLGVSGSIAAYKACEYARLLTSRGYQVRVVMSSAAQEFVSPLTFHALTGQAVCSDYFEGSEEQGIGHIEVADWADAMVVAPASADCIAKLAHGFADNCLLGAALATKAPVLVAPAMNVNMWENSATQANVTALRERGIQFVEPEEGDLACGWTGDGRLADPWEIFYATRRILSTHDFAESKVLT